MAKKQKSKKKVETKTITKKDIDKLLEDNKMQSVTYIKNAMNKE